MKKEDLPQDKGSLDNFTREVCYVKDENGKFVKGLSEGWETKQVALDNAWEEIDRVVEEVKQEVISGQVSPVKYFMELRIMDLPVLAGYTGFWSWQIKRHMKPGVFKKLSAKKIQIYADAFDVSVDELTNFKG